MFKHNNLLGDMKEIFDLDFALTCIANEVIYNDKPVAYGHGDVDALKKWIANKNGQQVNKALGIDEATKYPLIWLVEGWDGLKVVSGIEFEKVVFHVSVNSNIPDLNANRKPQFDILFDVSNEFINQLKYHGVKVLPELKFTKRANFSVSQGKETKTIDVWDTVIIQAKLLINTNCLRKLCGA